MEILHYQGKGTHLNTIERVYIHTQFTANNHLNDPKIISPSVIFDALTKGHRRNKLTLPTNKRKIQPEIHHENRKQPHKKTAVSLSTEPNIPE
jgi:hypothetical protein